MKRLASVSCMIMAWSGVAHGQHREPLCVATTAQRVTTGVGHTTGSEGSMVVLPLRTGSADGGRYVVTVPGLAHGASVFRLDGALHRIGEASTVGSAPYADVHGASLPHGVLLLLRDPTVGLFATWVDPTGAVVTPRSVIDGPVAWSTVVARGDDAVALAGRPDGEVIAMHFDAHGALRGTPVHWSRHVGGPMQLVPTDAGPVAALLGRPVQGTGPDGEPARVQVMVTLDGALQPVGDPVNTGFAQFPMAFASRPHTLMIFQWAQQQGVAIATLPVSEHRIGAALPRTWYAQPPLEGANVGHATTTVDGVVFNAVLYAEGTGIHTHVAWVPPTGTPIIRRDVLPLVGSLLTPPVLLPADDGFVLFTAITDETGPALDAYHVHCDLVSVPTE